MFGALMVGIKEIGMKLLSPTSPISIGGDEEVQIIKQPQGPIDFIFNVINRLLRPALLILVLYMFYWFTVEPKLAKDWILIVKEIPTQMWDAIMIILVSVGLSKVIRDAKNPHSGPQMVVKQCTPEDTDGDGIPDGAAKPDLAAAPASTETKVVNPTLAAWKANNQSQA
jgi:hypothetical protein